MGDAEAYLAEYRDHEPTALKRPLVAARIAQRLTAAGRAEEALALLHAAKPSADQAPPGPGPWIDARIAALDQLERGEEAQQVRWRFALLRLSSQHLRDHLKRLPAFEDGEAQEQALDLVLAWNFTTICAGVCWLVRKLKESRSAIMNVSCQKNSFPAKT